MPDVVQQKDTNLVFPINTFEKTLKPFIVLLGFIGVPTQTTPGTGSRPKLIWSFIVLFLHLSIQFATLVFNIEFHFDLLQNKSTFSLAINSLIGHLNFSIYVIFSHIALLTISQMNNWKQISNVFNSLEKKLKSSQHFQKESKKVVTFFMIYVLFSVSHLVKRLR